MKNKLYITLSVLLIILIVSTSLVLYGYSQNISTKKELNEQYENLYIEQKKFEKGLDEFKKESERFQIEYQDFMSDKEQLKKDKKEFKKEQEKLEQQKNEIAKNETANQSSSTIDSKDKESSINNNKNTKNVSSKKTEKKPNNTREQNINAKINEIDNVISNLESEKYNYPEHSEEYRNVLNKIVELANEKRGLLQQLIEINS